jgi:hypothetical protein
MFDDEDEEYNDSSLNEDIEHFEVLLTATA